MISTGSKVKIINILDKVDGKHLLNLVGSTGDVVSWHYLTTEDKNNDNKRCKVKIDGTEETYYFISNGELEEV